MGEIKDMSIDFTQEQLFALVGELYCHRKVLYNLLFHTQQELQQIKKSEGPAPEADE